jgi:hypothetical protein
MDRYYYTIKDDHNGPYWVTAEDLDEAKMALSALMKKGLVTSMYMLFKDEGRVDFYGITPEDAFCIDKMVSEMSRIF